MAGVSWAYLSAASGAGETGAGRVERGAAGVHRGRRGLPWKGNRRYILEGGNGRCAPWTARPKG